MTDDTLQAALDYVARGWSIVPVRVREKRPLIAWQIHQQHRAEAAQARAWFSRWPHANVGIVTGAVSGLVVIDIDPKHGGTESRARLEREHGPLPRTIEAISGGGGQHLYFAHPGGHVHNKVALAPGIDLRGDGGLVVAPPSVHPCGARYRCREDHAPWDLAPAPLPGWLLEEVAPQSRRPGHSLSYWRRLIVEGVPEGNRNNTITSLAGHLLWHGIDPDVATELLLCWNRERCRPPLEDAEVVRILESIGRMHRREPGDEEIGRDT